MPGEIRETQENQLEPILDQLAHINFETDRGSVYGFDEEGHVEGVQLQQGLAEARYEVTKKGDITVFSELNSDDFKMVADILQKRKDRVGEKLYAVEMQDDDKPKVIRKFSDVVNPDRLFLGIQTRDGKFFTKPASLLPSEGSTYFSYKYLEDKDKKGEGRNERFIGRVQKIIYK